MTVYLRNSFIHLVLKYNIVVTDIFKNLISVTLKNSISNDVFLFRSTSNGRFEGKSFDHFFSNANVSGIETRI